MEKEKNHAKDEICGAIQEAMLNKPQGKGENMKITIREHILSGNMGDGWKSQEACAHGFAAYLKPILESEATEMFPGAEITVDIEVQNASGYARPFTVDYEPADADIDTHEDHFSWVIEKAWENWCGGDGDGYAS